MIQKTKFSMCSMSLFKKTCMTNSLYCFKKAFTTMHELDWIGMSLLFLHKYLPKCCVAERCTPCLTLSTVRILRQFSNQHCESINARMHRTANTSSARPVMKDPKLNKMMRPVRSRRGSRSYFTLPLPLKRSKSYMPAVRSTSHCSTVHLFKETTHSGVQGPD